ncbi:MAG: translation elongation factor Ts [Spirochaetales bacterium]|nr:translation elongation factor Ts [Spirochaetales bacterium]
MEIKAAEVKKLRQKTGAGMVDCKNALVKAEGDPAKAERFLKELGLAAAEKRSGRATNQGSVFTKIKENEAVILEVGCETDFVANNEDFAVLGNDLAELALKTDSIEPDDEMKERVTETISTIKENISLKRFKKIKISDNEIVVDYIHGGGSIGILVKFQSEKKEALSDNRVKALAFDCALHIAAYNPEYLSRADIPSEYVTEQEEIFTVQAKNLGRPEKVLEGIVKGKMNKHFGEICFLEQAFVKDDKQSVEKVLKALSNEIGSKITVTEYIYYRVGEEV